MRETVVYMINSHVQMPRVILKQFEDEKAFLYYFDFEERIIKRGHSKTLYTEPNYYNLEAEKYFSAEIESKMGILIKFLKAGKLNLCESCEKYDDIAFDYFYSLISRSTDFITTLKDLPILEEFYDNDEGKRGLIASSGIEALRKTGVFRKIYQVYYARNSSDEEFILSAGGRMNSAGLNICPVTPRWAIVFYDQEFERKPRTNHCFEIEENEVIHDINVRLFTQENDSGKKYVISGKRDLIEKMVNEFKMIL